MDSHTNFFGHDTTHGSLLSRANMSRFNAFKAGFPERLEGGLGHVADNLGLVEAPSESGRPEEEIWKDCNGSSPGGANKKLATG
jgi:hypothetical protein